MSYHRKGLMATSSKWADLGDGCIIDHDPETNPDCDSPPPPPVVATAPARADAWSEPSDEVFVVHSFGPQVVGQVFDQPMTVAGLRAFLEELTVENVDPSAVICAIVNNDNAVLRIAAIAPQTPAPADRNTLTLPAAPAPLMNLEAPAPQLPAREDHTLAPSVRGASRRPVARRG